MENGTTEQTTAITGESDGGPMPASERAARTAQYLSVRASSMREQAKAESDGDWRESDAGQEAVRLDAGAAEWRQRTDQAMKEEMHADGPREKSRASEHTEDPETERLVSQALESVGAAELAETPRPQQFRRGGNSGWSEGEREVMRETDTLYEALRAEGRRRPSRSQVRRALRSLGEGIEVVEREQCWLASGPAGKGGSSWRRSCRSAANELGPDAYQALATLALAGEGLARSLAKAERARSAKLAERRSESKRMDAIYERIRALRQERPGRGEIAEALFRLDPTVVLEKLSGSEPFGRELIGAYASEEGGEVSEEKLQAAIVVAASPVGLVRQLRPHVAIARRRIAEGEKETAEALAELRSSVERRPQRRKESKGEEQSETVKASDLPEPAQKHPERIWEFQNPLEASGGDVEADGDEASPDADEEPLVAAAKELGIDLSGVGVESSTAPASA